MMNSTMADGDLDAIRVEVRERRCDLRDAGRDGHGDGQDVVGQQGGAGGLRGQLAQVVACDDVRAAAAGVGVDGLLVREGQDGQQDDDADGEGHGVAQAGRARAASTSIISWGP